MPQKRAREDADDVDVTELKDYLKGEEAKLRDGSKEVLNQELIRRIKAVKALDARVRHTRLEPQTSRPQAGRSLTRAASPWTGHRADLVRRGNGVWRRTGVPCGAHRVLPRGRAAGVVAEYVHSAARLGRERRRLRGGCARLSNVAQAAPCGPIPPAARLRPPSARRAAGAVGTARHAPYPRPKRSPGAGGAVRQRALRHPRLRRSVASRARLLTPEG